VRIDQSQVARQVINGLGHANVTDAGGGPPGFRRLQVDGLDVPAAIRGVHARAGRQQGAVVAGPNHVFLSAPFEHGGPFGPPVPAVAGTLPPGVTPETPARISVLDTGIWKDSPLPDTCYTATDSDYEVDVDIDGDGILDTDVGHANFIAGVVMRNTVKARIRIVRVLDTFGLCTEVDLANALLRLTDVDVINLSLGGFTVDDSPPVVLQSALRTLLEGHDRVLVAAAGNDGQRGRPYWPAAFAADDQPWCRQIVAVAAHDGHALCDWSNAGDWVSLLAPGADITSTFVHHEAFTDGWAQWSGTSFAAPYVVAAVADRIDDTGSAVAALEQVRALAASHEYGQFPALI
jgi:subtilisin family serine protease